MSFLPVFNSLLSGALVVSLFTWNIWWLPVIVFLFLLSVLFFWFDLIGSKLHYESAFWLFIISEVMAFGSLLTCCFYFDTCSYINLSSPLEIPLLGCFILLGSSVTVTAFHHLIGWEGSIGLLGLTILLGACFIVLQMVEMNEIGMNIFDTSFHATSFCTIGLHFSHVLLGVIGLSMIVIFGIQQTGWYRCTLVTWYWHFVDYIWLFVYAFVYVCFTDSLFNLANCGFADYSLIFYGISNI